jgi:hypothetical protein
VTRARTTSTGKLLRRTSAWSSPSITRRPTLNFALYELEFTGKAYNGKNPPLRDIVEGNNEFYPAHNGYDQATGVGVMDVANFALLFR